MREPTPWDERADAYRASEAHRSGADLDLLVEACEPAPGVEALDVATGGGHVAGRLREAGCRVTTTDASAAMAPDVVCRADALPFADASFDLVASRYAAHHFDDVAAAVRELARVARDRVVVADTVYAGERVEEAERLRDPSHGRNHTEEAWRGFFAGAGLRVDLCRVLDKWMDVEAWLARTGCTGEAAARVRELVADRTRGAEWNLPAIVIRGRKG
jgi:SAM-dependent methyltransferase